MMPILSRHRFFASAHDGQDLPSPPAPPPAPPPPPSPDEPPAPVREPPTDAPPVAVGENGARRFIAVGWRAPVTMSEASASG